jgi:T5SS/PEP-CTERM-associated repeat protein
MKKPLTMFLAVRGHRLRSITGWALFAFLATAATAFAQTTVWTDGTGNWFNPTNWSAGAPDANTTALINNGGTAQIMSSGAAASEVELGVGVADSGALSTSGSGNLQDGGSVYAGRSGMGSVSITSGGVVSSIRFVIGENSGSNGTATVSGSGSMWTNVAVCFVGFDGNGTLNIIGGGQVSNLNSTSIGENGTGIVTVDGVGSTWGNDAPIDIGGSGAGTLTISNGGHVTSFNSAIGRNPGSNGLVNVNGAGSSWTNNGFLALSEDGGDGTLHIMSGGTASNGACLLGTFSGSGTVTVDGVGSTWTINGDVSIGDVFGGIGIVTISQGGQVTSDNGFIADGSSSTGSVQVDGAGSTWTNSGNVYVGGTANGAVGIGELHLTNGGTVGAAAVTVWSTGNATGNGVVQTTNGVTNQGTLTPDETISVIGNLTFSSTATMLSTVTPNTADSVMVQGMTALNGHLGVTLTGGPFIAGTQYTLLQASSGLNGTTFANVSISAPPGVNAQVTYDLNHVYLVIIKGRPRPTPTPRARPTPPPRP